MPEPTQISCPTKGRRSPYYDSIILSIFISIVIKYYWAARTTLTLNPIRFLLEIGNHKEQSKSAVRIIGFRQFMFQEKRG